MRSIRSVGRLVVAVGLLTQATSARAALNEPIAFSQAGTVTVALDASSGGFDHVLELASSMGAVGTPIFALTDLGNPSPDVLGFAPVNLGDSASLGFFAAGEELVFRLTNVESPRLGTPGTLSDQTFSGSASSNNPTPDAFYTLIDVVDPLTIRVYWEDLFPIAADDPDPENAFLASEYDVAFTLTLEPVPEPGTLMLLIAGGMLVSLKSFRRRTVCLSRSEWDT